MLSLLMLPISTIEKISKSANKFITAVGTTSLRTIESLYWMGVKIIRTKNISYEDFDDTSMGSL